MKDSVSAVNIDPRLLIMRLNKASEEKDILAMKKCCELLRLKSFTPMSTIYDAELEICKLEADTTKALETARSMAQTGKLGSKGALFLIQVYYMTAPNLDPLAN